MATTEEKHEEEKKKVEKTKKEKLLEKKAQIDAQLKELQYKEAAQSRKEDTRRKIVLGGAFIALDNQGQEITKESVIAYVLNHEKSRESDKQLMNFFNKPKENVEQNAF